MVNVAFYVRVGDILVHTWSSTWKEHLEVLKKVLRRLDRAGLNARSSNCVIATETVRYNSIWVRRSVVAPFDPNQVFRKLGNASSNNQTGDYIILGTNGLLSR